MRQDKNNPVCELVRQAGSQGKLARQLGVAQQTVYQWTVQGYVPVGRLVEIENLYGVHRSKLINPRLKDLLSSEG